MAAGIELYNHVLNQKGSPALYSDIFANRPAFGYTGRLFISTDTNEIYRDTGTSWVLISGGGGGNNIYNTSDTLTGNRTLTNGGFTLTFTGAANPFLLNLDANTNVRRRLAYTTGGVDRWRLDVTDNETGSNAGSNFYLVGCDDTGALLNNWLFIERRTGEVSFYQEELLNTNGQNLTGIYNVTRGTYTAASYTGGNPQGSLFNLFTFDPRTNVTFPAAQYVATYSNIWKFEPTDTQTVTMTQSTGIRTMGAAQNQIQFTIPATKTLTVSHVSNYTGLGVYGLSNNFGNLTITNAYQILLNDLNEYSSTGLTLTNRWGIYQAGANDINYFNANTLFGTTTNAGYKVDVSGTARVTQSAYFATASGNVGIGTTSAIYKLQVIANTNGVDGVNVTNDNGGISAISGYRTINLNGIGTVLGVTGYAASSAMGGANQSVLYTIGNQNLLFGTNTTERMRIFSNGNVRIASSFTDSGQLLQVDGTSLFTSTINANGSGSSVALQMGANTAIRSTQTIYLDFASSGTGNLDIRGGSSLNTVLYLTTSENVGIGTQSFGTSATKTISVRTGSTSPSSSPADCFQLYSADITAGNAAAHFRTENGAIVKVYQETTAVGSATVSSPGAGSTIKTDDTFDGYTLQQVVKALRNQGLLA